MVIRKKYFKKMHYYTRISVHNSTYKNIRVHIFFNITIPYGSLELLYLLYCGNTLRAANLLPHVSVNVSLNLQIQDNI